MIFRMFNNSTLCIQTEKMSAAFIEQGPNEPLPFGSQGYLSWVVGAVKNSWAGLGKFGALAIYPLA